MTLSIVTLIKMPHWIATVSIPMKICYVQDNIMLSVVMLSVSITPIILGIIMLSVFMLNFVMLNVVIQNVMAPQNLTRWAKMLRAQKLIFSSNFFFYF